MLTKDERSPEVSLEQPSIEDWVVDFATQEPQTASLPLISRSLNYLTNSISLTSNVATHCVRYAKYVKTAVVNLIPFPWRTQAPNVVLLAINYEFDPQSRLELLKDYRRRLLFTYRDKFSPIEKSNNYVLSDSGWGCMIRVCQMLLAQCFTYHIIGRTWDMSEEKLAGVDPDLILYRPADDEDFQKYVEILENFLDVPHAPFSVHSFVATGKQILHKQPSSWFGPNSGAQCMATLMETHSDRCFGLRCVVFDDGSLYKETILKGLRKDEPQASGVMLLMCLKLGLDQFHVQKYQQPIQCCFSVPQFQGLAGGGPTTSAYFFVGANSDHLFYMDPHTKCQAALESTSKESLAASQLHSSEPQQLSWDALNPSMCLGFLCQDEAQVHDLFHRLKAADPEGVIFELSEGSPPNYSHMDMDNVQDGFCLL